MKAKIAHRIRGRCRFATPYSFNQKEYGALKYELESFDGVISVDINSLNGSIVVEYKEEILPNICKYILDLDLKAINDSDICPTMIENQGGIFEIVRDAFYKRFVFNLFLPLPVRNVMTLIRSFKYIKSGVKSIIKGNLNVDVLDASAISISLLTDEFKAASSIMFLLNLGEKLEEYTLKKSKDDLAKSLELNIDKVFVIDGDKRVLKSLRDVNVSDVVDCKMGSTIPVDGIVIGGEGFVNQSSFTGESMPVHKTYGKTVFAGTVLEEGNLYIKTTKKHNESRINNIIALIEDSERNKSLSQRKAETRADSLVKYSFIGAALAYIFTGSLIKAKAFLMVDFSCALKLTIPIAVMKAMSQATENGTLVKGGRYMESLAHAHTIVFDKTGTLTKSQPCVEKVITFDNYDENECLRIAACLEEHFPHSIANAVVEEAKKRGLVHDEMHTEPKYIVAHGIASTINGQKALIGSHHFIFEDEKVPITDEKEKIIDDLKENHSLLFLSIGNSLIGVICISDPIREDAKLTIKKLRGLGYKKIVMLTGDAENAARNVAEELDLDYYKSQVLPEDKADFVEKEKAKGRIVVLIGDGINDSVALSSADVGISMKKGADIAKEISDISIGSDDLESIVDIVKISKGLEKRIAKDYREIISFNSLLIILGFFGLISNTSSAFLHNSSTVLNALNNMKRY